MSSINTNLSAITALQSLKATQNAMNKNQDQISTGLRVGEASHNASYWSISTKMKSDNGALGAVKDSIKQSKAMIDTYSSAIDKSLKYLDTMKTKLTAGSNPGADLAAIQVELKSSIEGLKSAAASATFNGQNWLEGAPSTVKLVTSYDGESQKVNTLDIDTTKVNLFDNAANPTGGLLKAVSDIDIVGTANNAGYANLSVSTANLTTPTGNALTFKVDGADKTYTLVAGDTSMSALAANINLASGTLGVKATITDDNKLRLTSLAGGKDVTNVNFADITAGDAAVANTGGVAGYQTIGLTSSSFSSGDQIKFTDASGTARTFQIGSEASLDEVVASINADKGLNSVVKATNDAGKLRLTSTNTAGDITALQFNDNTKGVSTTGRQIAVAEALRSVDRAINDLRSGSAMLGANKALLETQEDFIGVLSDSLTAGVSAFIDADMNEVSTRNQALQTQQQLGVQALSMANQNSQMILKLFQ